MKSLLPDRTPPPAVEARPIILSPSVALHQEGQVHTVGFRVRAFGELLDDNDRFAGLILMDSPGTLKNAAEASAATIHVLVPVGIVEQFRSQTEKEFGRYVMDRLMRVRGQIQRQRTTFESSDGHLVDHAQVRIDLASLDRIGVVLPTTQPGSERTVPIGPEEEREVRPAVSAETLLDQHAPPLHAGQWHNGTGPSDWEHAASQVVLLDFWGQWCAPCVRKLPRLQQLHEKYHDRGLIVLGIHTPKRSENLDNFLRDKQITFPILLDSGKTAEDYGVQAWPTCFLIDKNGRLVWGFSHTPPTDAQVEVLLGI